MFIKILKGDCEVVFMFAVMDFENEWKENQSYDKGVLLFMPTHKCFVKASMGTGDNLLKEDMEKGFNDYIYIEQLEFAGSGMQEVDGAQLMFNNEKEDYYKNLKHFCDDSISMLGFQKDCDYQVLQMV